MRSVAPMRTAKIGYIIVSVLLCVLGILLIAVPEFSISAVGTICGAILIVFGAIRLIGYFSKDLYRLAFQYDLAFGIMMIALGVIMLWHPGSLMNFICITLGLSFLTDGLFKIQIAIDSKTFGIREWWLILAMAIVTVIFGGILIARPSESSSILTVLIGISMLCEGILNIGTMITAVKIIKHQQPDVIEVDYYEERED
ncbi:MAG: HdeD family acid-resistance protein [Monoglobaceae bacterium]